MSSGRNENQLPSPRGMYAILFMGEKPNPCVGCGACCAFFRVQYDRTEEVPGGLFENLSSTQRCMLGTAVKHRPKCAALIGRIGQNASCSIYESRPTPCRAFTASYADGIRNERCEQARRAHGLRPLRPSDWR